MHCSHDGFHSGRGRYDRENGHLRYVVICDECEAEVTEIHTEAYQPSFDPHGNDDYLKAA
jgi:hypothetical protein